MIERKGNIRRKILTIVLFSLYLAGVIGYQVYPTSINPTYNLQTTTKDGETVSYDLFEPVGMEGKIKNAIILGHGIMANKQNSRILAMDLASQGFLTIALDFRGHGLSTGQVDDNLKLDILAVKDILAKRGDINMTNLGYLGYSMGGMAGFNVLFTDNDFRAMVGVAPAAVLENINVTNPQNLLMVVGRYDEAISVDSLKAAMQNKTNIPAAEIRENVLYGDFENGTAAKLYVDEATEHFFAPYDLDFVREARNWFMRALVYDVNPSTNYSQYFIQIIMIFMAAIAGVWCLLIIMSAIWGIKFKKRDNDTNNRDYKEENSSSNPSPNPSPNPSENNQSSDSPNQVSMREYLKKAIIFELVLSLPCMLITLPLGLTPFPSIFLNYAMISGVAIPVLIIMAKDLKTKTPKIRFWAVLKEFYKELSIEKVIFALGFGIILHLVINSTVGMIWGMSLSVEQWPWFPLFFLISLGFLNIVYVYSQTVLDFFKLEKKKESVKVFGVITVLFCGILVFDLIMLSIFAGTFFILMMAIVAVPIFMLMIIIDVYLNPKTQNPVIISLIGSIFFTIFMVSAAPGVEMSSFMF
jgi:pimeloyl-ACP methyl ester carboxylesterase